MRTRHLLWFAHQGKAEQLAVDQDGRPIPSARTQSGQRLPQIYNGQRLPQIYNGPMPVRRMPMPLSYYARRPVPGSPPPATLSSRYAAPPATRAAPTAARSAGQIRVWQTPTQQELKEEVQKER